tara:strand:+ start:508 stop:1236 length:729 start_codon:yes stop_codon:yes gene_type:complete
MATLRKLVSDVRGTHKILSTDALITDRVIASEIRSQSQLLIKRETNLRKLWASDTLYTTIPCLEMKEVPISDCCEYAEECNVSRTVDRLPRISEGNYQYVIQGVYSIDAMGGTGTKLKEITINRYLNLLKLPIVKNEYYFWISDGYLYVNNPLLKAIRLSAFFEEDVPSEIMYPDCDCGGVEVTDEEYCKNPLDKEYALPGYLESSVLGLVSQKLLATYFQIKTDMSNEGIDGQAPNAQPTQ